MLQLIEVVNRNISTSRYDFVNGYIISEKLSEFFFKSMVASLTKGVTKKLAFFSAIHR